MIASIRRRLVSRGDLPGSDGGVYNPGAILADEGIVLLARREIDYRFTPIVHAERIVLDPATLAVRSHRTLVRRGYAKGARLEDFRLLRHAGETLAVHTLIEGDRIRPVISRLGEHHIEPADPLALPFETDRVEKNWVLFEHDGALHCLYRLDPLTILVRDGAGGWRVMKRLHNGWGDRFRNMLSNSANLIPFRGGHLGFWHSIVDRRYVQGAMWLDERLDLSRATGVLIDGGDIVRGHKPGVLYTSALVEHAGRVLAFHGEADEHVGVTIFDADELAAELVRHPFEPAEPLVRDLSVGSMGDLFRTMDDLRASRAAPGSPPVWLRTPNRELRDLVRRFAVPYVSAREPEATPMTGDRARR